MSIQKISSSVHQDHAFVSKQPKLWDAINMIIKYCFSQVMKDGLFHASVIISLPLGDCYFKAIKQINPNNSKIFSSPVNVLITKRHFRSDISQQ